MRWAEVPHIFAGRCGMLGVIPENYGDVFGRDCSRRATLPADQQVVERAQVHITNRGRHSLFSKADVLRHLECQG